MFTIVASSVTMSCATLMRASTAHRLGLGSTATALRGSTITQRAGVQLRIRLLRPAVELAGMEGRASENIQPYERRFSTPEKLMKESNSGIRRVQLAPEQDCSTRGDVALVRFW